MIQCSLICGNICNKHSASIFTHCEDRSSRFLWNSAHLWHYMLSQPGWLQS